MNKKYEDLIMKIIRIKINLFYLIILGGGMLYSAEMLGDATRIREIFFWASILLMIAFQIFEPLRKTMDMIEEYIINKKDAKGRKTE